MTATTLAKVAMSAIMPSLPVAGRGRRRRNAIAQTGRARGRRRQRRFEMILCR
jgi:hypothetical protein